MTKTQANEPGFVLVPREPTDAMLDAAHEVPIACFEDDVECFTTNREATSLYRAMLAAAPLVPSPAYGGGEALEPFAKAADYFNLKAPLRPHEDDAEIVSWLDHRIGERTITVGDLRRARTAYDAIGSGVKALPDHVAQHYGDLGLRIVEFFDKDETAGSFLREDGDGGFVSGLYRMAREVDTLRTGAGAGVKAAWEVLGEVMSQGDYSRAAFERIEAALRSCLSPVAVEEADAEARPTDDQLWDQTLAERDNYHDAADKLAEAIGELLGVNVGEHSSAHSPWETALEHAGQAVRNRTPSTPSPQIGKAGAGPVGEAMDTVWFYETRSKARSDGPGGVETYVYGNWYEDFSRARPAEGDRIRNVRPFYAHPVEEPGEVERLTFDLRALKTAWDGAHKRAETAEAAIAETRSALKAHHDWHLAQEEAPDGVGGAEAYAESPLFSQTVAALTGDAQEANR